MDNGYGHKEMLPSATVIDWKHYIASINRMSKLGRITSVILISHTHFQYSKINMSFSVLTFDFKY